MDEQDLVDLARAWRDECLCGECCAIVPRLVAEVRRLRGELAAERDRQAHQARNFDAMVLAKEHATAHARELKAQIRRLRDIAIVP